MTEDLNEAHDGSWKASTSTKVSGHCCTGHEAQRGNSHGRYSGIVSIQLPSLPRFTCQTFRRTLPRTTIPSSAPALALASGSSSSCIAKVNTYPYSRPTPPQHNPAAHVSLSLTYLLIRSSLPSEALEEFLSISGRPFFPHALPFSDLLYTQFHRSRTHTYPKPSKPLSGILAIP